MVVIVNRFFNNKDIDELIKENAEKVAERKGKPTLTEKIMASSASAAQEEEKKYQSMSDIAKANRSKKDYTPKNYKPMDKDAPVNTNSISSIAHMLDRNKNDD